MIDSKKYDVLIVGTGITGAVVAERLACQGKKVLIIDKEKKVAGNCYDYINRHGVLVAKYGPHIFRTDDKEVWDYIKKFSKWNKYRHKIVSKIKNKYLPFPININTINILYNINISTKEEMISKLGINDIVDNSNFETKAISIFGNDLYKKMIYGYTKKQWGVEPNLLSHDILKNKNITVNININFFEEYDKFIKFDKIIYTGKLDDLYNRVFNKNKNLQYRSLSFKSKSRTVVENKIKFPVVNYPSLNLPYTRRTDYGVLYGSVVSKKITTVKYEYPCSDGVACYPFQDEINRDLSIKMKKEILKKCKNIVLLGRLAIYEYIDMDIAIKKALDLTIYI